MIKKSLYRAPRRRFLRDSLLTMGVLATGPTLMGCRAGSLEIPPLISNIANLGPLGDPDANGVRLPAGFSARILARSGTRPLADSAYVWHGSPDGGATFATEDGGWIYVSNTELPVIGGAGALRFSADGEMIDAYPILERTNINCAGGPTPWGTWLSCEEIPSGKVWECDPYGEADPVDWPALGVFQHEAATVDPIRNQIYLTEDVGDGGFYRFTPDNLTDEGYPDLSSGTLEILQVLDGETGAVRWHTVPDPKSTDPATKDQVAESTPFKGGEGIWFYSDIVYFTTKGDNRVWAYNVPNESIDLYYDGSTLEDPLLSGVDNIVVLDGNVVVAEDGGNLELISVAQDGTLVRLMQLVGQDDSEITGPAFSPDGTRLYFSSQRGETGDLANGGITFEIKGPFTQTS